MATSTPYVSRRGGIPYWLVSASLVATLIAILPIAGALFSGLDGSDPVARTAFATAPAGNYAVLARDTDGHNADIIIVVPAGDPAGAMEIARVTHLTGHASRGAVSPDGRLLALAVSDAGTMSRPVASLVLVNLETGQLTRLAARIEPLQLPAWAPDGRSIAVTRDAAPAGARSEIVVLRVAVDGSGEAEVGRFPNVLGAYAVSFDGQGRLVSVVIDGRGSTAYRDGSELASLSAEVTRDWRLSPDGSQLAFIESDLSAGLRYRARVVSLDGAGGGVSAQAIDDGSTQSLGVAWNPGGTVRFGQVSSAPVGVTAQSAGPAGFDVPLAFSRDGSALALERWSGASFSQPGVSQLEVEQGGQRTALSRYMRFYGWAAR